MEGEDQLHIGQLWTREELQVRLRRAILALDKWRDAVARGPRAQPVLPSSNGDPFPPESTPRRCNPYHSSTNLPEQQPEAKVPRPTGFQNTKTPLLFLGQHSANASMLPSSSTV